MLEITVRIDNTPRPSVARPTSIIPSLASSQPSVLLGGGIEIVIPEGTRSASVCGCDYANHVAAFAVKLTVRRGPYLAGRFLGGVGIYDVPERARY